MESTEARSRIDSVDVLRGIVMVVMLLDHTRDFVHFGLFQLDPTDVTKTWPALFFTRWITHFCAPVFVFLAGTGAYFQRIRGKSAAELSGFLVKRGFWLIVLEFTLVRLGAVWSLDLRFLGFAQVIWALGWSMIVLAGLIRFPLRAIGIFGVGMILLHNLLDPIRVTEWRGPGTPVPDASDVLWMVLHQPGPVFPAGFPGPAGFIVYPLIPWVGVMAAGYAFGRVYEWDAHSRRRFLLRTGIAVTLGFVALRALNLYGDPSDWAVQPRGMAMTIVSFLNVTKYPPSLLFLAMTLGPAFVALAYFERVRAGARAFSLAKVFIDFGRVPLFFYLLQWPMAHGMGVVLHLLTGKDTAFLFQAPFVGAPPPANAGFDLPVVYAAWIVGVILLYPLCRWYARYKATHRHWWLSYL